ncbi:hypothetical protein [Levilactobacillus bambusae]|uniref:Uncharacterized protein n=1 Tax=Levilactobacillus bambusae TaxID=2024736 RepID=A0A2V1MXJ3_9LACO|nr:hypothetical protein [Levilactobacillus bambusae]PWF99726.1 hypothetical protein DCM90_06610 [Levilactobacillus bambusae]
MTNFKTLSSRELLGVERMAMAAIAESPLEQEYIKRKVLLEVDCAPLLEEAQHEAHNDKYIRALATELKKRRI